MGLPPYAPHEPAPPVDSAEHVDEAAALRALADPARLRILAHLRARGAIGDVAGQEVCACDLEAVAGLSQPTVSHHMKRLAAAGLVRAEKRGRWTYYRLNRPALARLRTLLAWLEGG